MSYPTHELALEPDVFREAYTTYLPGGREPGERRAVRWQAECCRCRDSGAHVTYCDRSGHVLSAAHVPIETYDACHDAIVDRLSSLSLDEAGFGPRIEPRGIFTTLSFSRPPHFKI